LAGAAVQRASTGRPQSAHPNTNLGATSRSRLTPARPQTAHPRANLLRNEPPQVGVTRPRSLPLRPAGSAPAQRRAQENKNGTRPITAPASRTRRNRGNLKKKGPPTGRVKVAQVTGGAYRPIMDSFLEQRVDPVGQAVRDILNCSHDGPKPHWPRSSSQTSRGSLESNAWGYGGAIS